MGPFARSMPSCGQRTARSASSAVRAGETSSYALISSRLVAAASCTQTPAPCIPCPSRMQRSWWSRCLRASRLQRSAKLLGRTTRSGKLIKNKRPKNMLLRRRSTGRIKKSSSSKISSRGSKSRRKVEIETDLEADLDTDLVLNAITIAIVAAETIVGAKVQRVQPEARAREARGGLEHLRDRHLADRRHALQVLLHRGPGGDRDLSRQGLLNERLV